MQTLVVATSNPGKVAEMETYLKDLPVSLVLKPKHIDIEETGATYMENARLKASQVAKALGQWAIADDSGLGVDALDGAPGLYSARYAPTAQACIERLLQELKGQKDRSAQFYCAIAIADPRGAIALDAEGVCHGQILEAPQGAEGFGYDPVFYVPTASLTFAEMPATLKDEISHRGRAFQALMPALTTLING
ncbi:MAG: RdgB/HAM1 family non-canonical purine NTP pyrophosphatase [Cyanobacteria bacterium P01_A01_bin.135]